MKLMRWIALLVAALALPAQAELRDVRYDYQRAERAQTDFTVADAAVQRVVLAQLMLAQVTTNSSVTGVFNPASPGPIGATTPDAITGTTITATTKIVNAPGNSSGPTWIFSGDTNGWYQPTAQQWGFGGSGGSYVLIGTNIFRINNTMCYQFSSTSAATGSADTGICFDAANTLAQRNGTNAQRTKIFNTFTDASNGEWLDFQWTGSQIYIRPSANGTGTLRQLNVQGGGTLSLGGGNGSQWQIPNTGALQPISDNTYDIGVVTTQRVRDLYLNGGAGGNATTGAVGEYLSATSAAGTTTLSNNTSATVTSQSLTAGDWDCAGVINFTSGATTSYTNIVGGTSTTAATLGTQDTTFDWETAANIPTATKVMSWVVPTTRYVSASSQTVYLVAQATFTSTAPSVGGTLRCRRIR